MFNIKVIDKYKRNYPQLMRKATDRFLNKAGALVAGRASLLSPVDQGDLAGSIRWEVKGDECEVEANTDYAYWVEVGTRPHAINSPVKIKKDNRWVYIGQHPGTKAQPFMRPALDGSIREIRKMYGEEIQKVFR